MVVEHCRLQQTRRKILHWEAQEMINSQPEPLKISVSLNSTVPWTKVEIQIKIQLTISKTWKRRWRSKTKTFKILTSKTRRKTKNCSKMNQRMTRMMKIGIIGQIWLRKCSIRITWNLIRALLRFRLQPQLCLRASQESSRRKRNN